MNERCILFNLFSLWNYNTMQSKKPIKRRQISNACIACRKAHRACDVQRPCQRCISKGIECTTVHSQTVDEIFGSVAREMQTDGFVFEDPVEQNYDITEFIGCSGSPSDPASENNLQYSNNSDLQAAALERITNLENELQQLREIINNALQPQINSSPVVSSKMGHVKWDINTRRIIGCNDAFYELFGITRQELSVFEQWMSSGAYPKIKFILENLNSGAKLVEVKAVFRHPTTRQERCIFLQFTRDSPESNIVSTNVVPLDHYDNEFRVDDYTQFSTISKQCFAISTQGNSIPWQCCCPDEQHEV